jgi:Ser/Thr protein kinase RdoA (MazF antagonist)
LWIAVALAFFAEWRDSGKEWRRLKDRPRDSQIRAFGRRAANLMIASRRFGFRRFARRRSPEIFRRLHVCRRVRSLTLSLLAAARNVKQLTA